MLFTLGLILSRLRAEPLFEEIYWPPISKTKREKIEFEKAISELFDKRSTGFWERE